MTAKIDGDWSERAAAAGEAGRDPGRVAPATRWVSHLRQHRRFGGLALGLAAVSLLSASCIRVDVGIAVNDDGSGTVSFLTAIDTTVAGSFAKSLGGTTTTDSEPSFADVDKSKLPAGATVEPYKEGKYEGSRITMPFRPGDDVAAIVNQISSSTGSTGTGATEDPGASSPLFEDFALKKEADGWSFKATVGPPNEASEASDLMSPEELKVFFKDASFTVRVKLPGSVSSHNADSRGKNGELVWKLDIFATKARTLSARTGPSTGGGFPVVPVAGGAAVVVALVAAAGFVVYRRQGVVAGNGAEAPAAEPTVEAAPEGEAPPA